MCGTGIFLFSFFGSLFRWHGIWFEIIKILQSAACWALLDSGLFEINYDLSTCMQFLLGTKKNGERDEKRLRTRLIVYSCSKCLSHIKIW